MRTFPLYIFPDLAQKVELTHSLLPWINGMYRANSFALFFSYPFWVMSPKETKKQIHIGLNYWTGLK